MMPATKTLPAPANDPCPTCKGTGIVWETHGPGLTEALVCLDCVCYDCHGTGTKADTPDSDVICGTCHGTGAVHG